MAESNPYASRKRGPLGDYSATGGRPYDVAMPHHEYAVPSLEAGGPYNTSEGAAQDMRPRIEGTPDAQRVRVLPIPLYDDTAYEGERKQRYAQENVGQDNQPEFKGIDGGHKRFADKPEVRASAEPRWTAMEHPGSYSFERPFDQRYSHRFSGEHFSMADHRRQYEVLGMQPQTRFRRSTNYIEPQPWGTSVIDAAADVNLPVAQNVSPEVPQTRTWGVR